MEGLYVDTVAAEIVSVGFVEAPVVDVVAVVLQPLALVFGALPPPVVVVDLLLPGCAAIAAALLLIFFLLVPAAFFLLPIFFLPVLVQLLPVELSSLRQ